MDFFGKEQCAELVAQHAFRLTYLPNSLASRISAQGVLTPARRSSEANQAEDPSQGGARSHNREDRRSCSHRDPLSRNSPRS
jgi:hypothetical protein